MAIRTATNPNTGERIAFINGQWVPYTRSATNPETKQKAVFVSGQWYTDSQAATPDVPEEESGFFRQVADIPVKAIGGVATGVRLITDAFGADNAVSQNIRGVESWINDLLSAQAKRDQQEVARIMKEAEDKGISDQIMAGLRAFQVAPLDTIAQAAGTTAPVMVGGLATALLRAPAVVGVVGTGAVMGAGTAKSSIYDATYEVLRENGASDREAKERAAEAQKYGGKNLDQILLGTALGGVAGRFGAEDVVARRLAGEISRRSLAKAGAGEAATEFTQAAQEQIAANVAQQREGFDVPTTRGAVSAGTMEALAGAAVGAGAEAIGRPGAEMPAPVPPPEVPPPVSPPVQPPPAQQTVQVDQSLAKQLNLPEAEGVPPGQPVNVNVGPAPTITPFTAEPVQLGLPGVPSEIAATTPEVIGQVEPPAVGGSVDVSTLGAATAGPTVTEPPTEGMDVVERPVPDTATGAAGVEPALTEPEKTSDELFNEIQALKDKAVSMLVGKYGKRPAGGTKKRKEYDAILARVEELTPQWARKLSQEKAARTAVEAAPTPAPAEPVVTPTSPAVEPAPTPAPVPAPAVPAVPTLREDATDEEIAAYYKAREEADRAAGIKPEVRVKAPKRFTPEIEEDVDDIEDFDEQRGEVPATPQVSPEDTQAAVDESVEGWTNAPKVIVAVNPDDPSIPEPVRASIKSDTKGVYADGTVYVLSDRATNQSSVRGTVFHESLGHFGLRQAFGNKLDSILDNIYNTNPQAKAAADELIAKYPELTPARAVNEALAIRSEAGPIKEAGLRAAFNRVAAFIRNVGRSIGVPIKYSDNDVTQILVQAHRRVVSGKPRSVKATRKNLRDFLNLPLKEVDSRGPLAPKQRSQFKEVYDTVADYLRAPMLGIQSLPELVDLYKNDIPTLRGLLDVVNERAFSLKERTLGVDRNVRRWAEILGKYPKQLAKFYSIALESTRLQIDFDDPADSGHSLTKEFNSLPEELRTVYREMREAYRKMADEYLDIITKNLPPTVANEFRKAYEAKRLKVYFPLYREGKYWLRYQDKNNETVVRAFQSRRARRLAERDAAADGAKGFQSYEKIEDVFRDPQAGFGFYSKAMGQLDEYYQNKYGEPAPLVLKQNLYEMFLDTIPAGSIRQQFRKREGYAGAERDLLGVYATMAPRMMNQLNNLEFNPKLDEVINLVNEDIQKSQSSAANDLRQEIQKRLDFLRDPTNNKWVNLGVFASYFDFIIGNISSAVANLTNLSMVVYPFLAGKYGYDKTGLAMEDATKLWFKGGWDNDGAPGVPKKWPADRTAFDKLPANSPLGRLFDRAIRENALKHSVAYDLLEARGQRMELKAGFLSAITGTNDYMGFWNKTKQGLGWVFQNTERFNREIALIAAFNLEMEKGKAEGKSGAKLENDAIRYAIDVVNQTNGVTLSEIGPRFFQKGILKVALTFKNFARTQYYLQYKLLKDMLKGAEIKTDGMTPEQAEEAKAINRQFRMIATRQWLGTLAGAFAFAGIQGLPFYGAAIMLASLVGDDDEPVDADERIKQSIGSLGYKGLANQLFMVDFASRTGFNGMLWRDDPKRLAEVGRFLFTLEQLMGPAYGSLRSRMNAYDDFVNGYTDRAIEKTLPLFARNALKAYRYATEGVMTKEKDARITEDPDSYELFMQAAGFNPTRIAEATARSGARKEIEKNIAKRKEALFQNYYNAWIVGDQEGIQDALEAIDKYNQSKTVAQLGAYIEKEDVIKSRETRRRNAARSLEGMTFSQKMAKGMKDIIKE